jgi:nitroreductase
LNVTNAIEKRRAYRSLDPIKITQELIDELGKAAQLSPSCFNNQPWNFIFVYKKEILKKMHDALSKGNEWAKDASLIICVCASKNDDCVIGNREYFLFDTGLASAFLILKATEMNIVAHPIAGFSPKKTREILNIPEDIHVISLIIVGKHSNIIKPILSEKQQEIEKNRPKRKPLNEFIHVNQYSKVN